VLFRSKMASMLGVVDENRQLIAAEDGLYIRETGSGQWELVQPLEADNANTRSNDGRVHPSGALWIGTMGLNLEPEAGAIYWFFKGELKCLYANITVPNSICFSPQGDIAYFIDTPTGKLMRVTVDPATGFPTDDPEILYDHSGQNGFLDGSVVDADGTIWNAGWAGSCLNVISSAGQLLRTIDLPTGQLTCPAFIGPDLDRLLVTSAWQGMSDERRRTDLEAGKTFIMDLSVKGKSEPYVVL